jgi:hypothetical protein
MLENPAEGFLPGRDEPGLRSPGVDVAGNFRQHGLRLQAQTNRAWQRVTISGSGLQGSGSLSEVRGAHFFRTAVNVGLFSDLPFYEQSVGGNSRAEAESGVRPVKVAEIDSAEGTEAVEIEVGVFGLERVECPGDLPVSKTQGSVPLGELQLFSDTASLVLWNDGENMRVLDEFSLEHSGKRIDKANELAVAEGAQD